MQERPPHAAKAVKSVFLASIALLLAPAAAHADQLESGPSFPAFNHSSVPPEGGKRYIVKYGKHVDSEAESESLKEKGIEVKETLSHAMKASVVVATPAEIEAVRNSEDVASVEPDNLVSVFGATSIWGLDRIDQRSGRDGQYSIGDEGAGVDVYVVDTGLNVSHSEFSGRITSGWSGIQDGRGVQDCSGHGTHVAGTVAGTTYGVAKKANIIPVRVLQCDGSGWSSSVMAGIDWAISHHVQGRPAVMNLSVGGFTNASFDETVQSAVNDGITVVAAAGNSGVDSCAASPARVPSAITVAATNINDAQVSWSNYGSCVDVQAPGLSVRSAWINSPTAYNTLDGTSMAAPHVSGAAAILLSRNPALTPSQVHHSVTSYATTDVISANKGSTPNRLLFIPAPRPATPSCLNLQLGDAWAGIGTHCGLQGSAVAPASVPEAAVTIDEAPAATAGEAPAATVTPGNTEAPEAPATTPDTSGTPENTGAAAAPADARPAPAGGVAGPASSQQIPAVSTHRLPVTGDGAQAVAEPAVVAPGFVVEQPIQGPVAATAEAPPSPASATAASVVASGSEVSIARAGRTGEDAAGKTGAEAASAGVATVGLVLGGIVVGGFGTAYAARRRKSSTNCP